MSSDSHPEHHLETALNWSPNDDGREGKSEHDPIVFSPRDRNSIRNYYRGAPSNLPPGLRKRNGMLPRIMDIIRDVTARY